MRKSRTLWPVVLDGADVALAEAAGRAAEGQAEADGQAPAADVAGTEDGAGEGVSGETGTTRKPPSTVLQRVEAARVEVTLTDFDPDVQRFVITTAPDGGRGPEPYGTGPEHLLRAPDVRGVRQA